MSLLDAVARMREILMRAGIGRDDITGGMMESADGNVRLSIDTRAGESFIVTAMGAMTELGVDRIGAISVRLK